MRGTDYSNSDIAHLIEEYVHKDRDREILRLRLLCGHTYDAIAEELSPPLSGRQVSRIVAKESARLFRYLKTPPE